MARKKTPQDKTFTLSHVQSRMVEASVKISMEEPEKVAYQHTVLCQTCLPYRNPSDETREWSRQQGNAFLKINAGEACNPVTGQWVKLGLPYGPKVRLVLSHLNSEAIRTASREVEVEDSMTAFIRRLQQRTPTGPEIRKFKDQLSRLAAATLRLAVAADGRSVQVNSQIIEAFDLWFPKDERQRVLWPSTVELSHKYFHSLTRHAVPLDERALAALSHSAMALDVYCWLAQRLHRVKGGQFIPWPALYEQFGQGYARLRDFRAAFLKVLKLVKLAYPAAKFGTGKEGMLLGNSPPPVRKRMVLIDSPKK